MGRFPSPRTIYYRDVEAFLPTMHKNNDILTFMMVFERSIELNGIGCNLWVCLLSTQRKKGTEVFCSVVTFYTK